MLAVKLISKGSYYTLLITNSSSVAVSVTIRCVVYALAGAQALDTVSEKVTLENVK